MRYRFLALVVTVAGALAFLGSPAHASLPAPDGASSRLGVDYAWQKPTVDSLQRAGARFAVRYLSYDRTGKNLSASEAVRLRAAGVDVVSNWEWGTRDALRGYATGYRQALDARALHLALGGPRGAPIYFSVDFDVTPGEQSSVNEYFRGVRDALGGPEYVGVYGGYWAVSRVLDTGYAAYGWQTYAWSGGRWDPRARIRQTRNGVRLGGAELDLDLATVPDYFGEWGSYGAGAPATPVFRPSSHPTLKPARRKPVHSTRYYAVRRGDTLGLIARRNRTTVSRLAMLNHIRNVNRIYAGQRIRVH